MRPPSLQQFFRHQLQQGYRAHGLNEAGTIEYVSDMLARFAHSRSFHALRDADGRPLEYIVDMLASWQQAQDSPRGRRDLARERTIIRHIGDYTLFMSGLFRERLKARGELKYYVEHGRTAFWHSADYEPNAARRHTYHQLSENFNPISDLLNYLRRVQLPLSGRAAPSDPLAAYWRV